MDKKTELQYRGIKPLYYYSKEVSLMRIKKALSMFIAAFSILFMFSISSYAENVSTFESDEIISQYAIAVEPASSLIIYQNSATCTSTTDGVNCVRISVTHTLQKYSGWLWIWDNVAGASWSKTVNLNSISLSNSKNGLSSGTYRLMSVFTLTNSNGQTETITIYSSEKTVS
jgi:hypothetical protein